MLYNMYMNIYAGSFFLLLPRKQWCTRKGKQTALLAPLQQQQRRLQWAKQNASIEVCPSFAPLPLHSTPTFAPYSQHLYYRQLPIHISKNDINSQGTYLQGLLREKSIRYFYGPLSMGNVCLNLGLLSLKLEASFSKSVSECTF